MNLRFSSLFFCAMVGCSDEQLCTAAGCTDGFTIHLVANEPLRDGSYEVAVTLDGVSVTCEHVIGGFARGPEPSCSSGRLRSTLSIHNGGAPPNPNAPNAILLDVASTPAVAVIEVRHDGTLIAQQTYNPTYQTISPNGPECGPVCDVAPLQTLSLTFD
ncbi:MAG TPA: hypothetical protein VNN80_00510 [Polyangiaceae bacterium]|nr:hypothetical protein [Polyangiaceae bacterium]